MNAVPPSFHRASEPARAAAGQPNFASAGASATSMKWAALAEAASVVTLLAGVEPERPAAEVRNFPALIREADPWRRDRAEHGIGDLAAIMEPGLAALLAVNARGADPRPAALVLLQEFNAARAALLALLPPTGAMGPRRTA
jgi:hypothetical protein